MTHPHPRTLLCAAVLALAAPAAQAAAPADVRVATAMAASHADLVKLFSEWRAFVRPAVRDGVPDYGEAAMAGKARELADYRARLAAIDPSGWTVAERNDWRLVEAEMNGFDFSLRVLKPWARDPSF